MSFETSKNWHAPLVNLIKILQSLYGVAAIAPCLPAAPGLNPKHIISTFFHFVLKLQWETNENKQKEAGIGPYFKKKMSRIISHFPVSIIEQFVYSKIGLD